MDAKVKNRLKWIKLYEELGNVKQVCQHFGISRFTLRKWSKRYKERGMEGLKNISTRPKNSPLQKRDEINEEIILTLRKERKLGVRRIQSELKRLHEISLSVATIHKVLKKHEVGYLQLKRHYRKQVKRYNCKIPGERVQMDVCKIAQGVYQYTAIDDCTRYKILGIYKRRTSLNTVNFLECVIKHMPFPIQRIQTDRGQEFFAYLVQVT